MTQNDLFVRLMPKCALDTLAINVGFIAIYCLWHRKSIKNPRTLRNGLFVLFGINGILAAIILFFGVYLVPPTVIVAEREVELPPEVITTTNVIEKENIIEIPSIMLPLNPEGTQAVVIDTTSTIMDSFMKEFYGENVYFFNSRQDATFLVQTDGIQNYSGLDIAQIEYHENTKTTYLQLDELNFETIWLFSDLSHIDLMPTNCNVILYAPYPLSIEQITELKTKGNITVITINQFVKD